LTTLPTTNATKSITVTATAIVDTSTTDTATPSNPIGLKSTHGTNNIDEWQTNNGNSRSQKENYDADGPIDDMVKSRFVTKDFYIDTCTKSIIQNVSLDSCFAECYKILCHSFIYSSKEKCFLNDCKVEENQSDRTPTGDETFVYFY